MDFTPINTQEELDAVIRSRLERERNKFADYDELKTAKADLEKALASAKAKAESDSKTQAQKIAELEKQNKEYAAAAVKSRIAIEMGIPMDIKDRLCGETEEEIRKDAERIAPLFANRQQSQLPLHNPESEPATPIDAAWRKLLEQTK